jgi:hypothetical protein
MITFDEKGSIILVDTRTNDPRWQLDIDGSAYNNKVFVDKTIKKKTLDDKIADKELKDRVTNRIKNKT